MREHLRSAVGALLALALAPLALAQEPQYVSPSGKKYFAQPDEKNVVAEAQKKLDADPKNLDLLIALGDAWASVWDHTKAIEVYDRALAQAPNWGLLYQQRGHRYLSNRKFDKARADLEKAVALDPKLRDAWYYLGFLRYLEGDFAGAADAYAKNVAMADKFESAIGAVDWQYMSLKRAKKDKEAAQLLERVTPELKIEGNARLYFNRLLFYKGLKKEDELFAGQPSDIEATTLDYGVGNWYLYNGKPEKARGYFEKAVATTAWPALAFIAAENELARAATDDSRDELVRRAHLVVREQRPPISGQQ
ncbi:MAG TPA: tetratricopeptide repeat protein [Vicinamibacteria bacterium]